MIVPIALAVLQAKAGAAILKELRTPVPFSTLDEQIRAQRERTLRNARTDPKGTFERAVAKAEQTYATGDIVLAVAAGIETVPRYAPRISRDGMRLDRLLRTGDPQRSLEYRRAAYLMQAGEFLVVVDADRRTDRDGPIRRALLAAYPDDPQVWMQAAVDALYDTRFVGDADARRVAGWWARWSPTKDPRFGARSSVWAQMASWLGIAAWTKAPDDALRAERLYHAWAKLAPASQRDDVKFYGDAVRGARHLAGLS